MTLYRIHRADDPAADSVVIEEVTHGAAAEEYAERCYLRDRETWSNPSTYVVQRLDGGEVKVIAVYIDWAPTFVGTEVT
jgi:type IV secretory pathway protease TraF